MSEATNNCPDILKDIVIKDLKALGRTGRIIPSSNTYITKDEYRIALRTGQSKNHYASADKYDYHFMKQHSCGRWSHKFEQQKSELMGQFWKIECKIWAPKSSYDYKSKIIYFEIK